MLAASPIELEGNGFLDAASTRAGLVALVAFLLSFLFIRTSGMLIPIVGLVGAVRLAKPESPWARRRYVPGNAKLVRATRRSERHARRYQRFQDRLAGAPAVDRQTDG